MSVRGGGALHRAALTGDLHFVGVLLKAGASVREWDCGCRIIREVNYGTGPPSCFRPCYPLDYAILSKSVAMVRLLLEYGADVNLKGILGHYPLVFAIQVGNPEIVRVLLTADGHAKSAPKAKEIDEATRMHGMSDDVIQSGFIEAAGMGQLDMVELLLEYGYDPLFIVGGISNRLATPFWTALANGHVAIADRLLQDGQTRDIYLKEVSEVPGMLGYRRVRGAIHKCLDGLSDRMTSELMLQKLRKKEVARVAANYKCRFNSYRS